MKNKPLVILAIIVLLVIIVCLTVLLCVVIKNDLHFRDFNMNKSNVIKDVTYEIDEITDLSILSSAGDIEIKESTDGKVRAVVYGEKEEDVAVQLDNGKLVVDYFTHKKGNYISFGINFYKRDVIVYLPRSYEHSIEVNTEYGDFDCIDLENATISIDSDCGDIKLGKVKNVNINSDYGDVDIECVLNKVMVETSCGDLKINSATIMENSEIKSDFGDVEIDEINDIFIDAKTDFGDTKIRENNRYSDITLKITNDCGDIEVGE